MKPGIDFSIAVGIRAWFQTEMQVDVSVLEMDYGETIAGLLGYILENIPKSVVEEKQR